MTKTKHNEDETITLDKVTMWKTISIALALALIISILTGGFGFGADTFKGTVANSVKAAAPTPSANPSPAPSQDAVDMVQLADDDAVKGAPNAPVTIVEWSDYECPFCSKFYSQTLSLIDENYIKTGKVKFIYRDFPLSFHKNSQKAAEASECAEEQGDFWGMHNFIFENQQILSTLNLKKWAIDLGLDSTKFDECLDSGKYYDEVQKDMADGAAIGIRGTPGFVINGISLSGAQPYSAFEQAIEEALGNQ